MKKIALLSLALASFAFATEWTLDTNLKYSFKAEGKALTAKHTLPGELSLKLKPENLNLNWGLKIKNNFDPAFASFDLSKAEVSTNLDYTSDELLPNFKVYTKSNIVIFNGDKTGNIDLTLGSKYDIKENMNLDTSVKYESNKLVAPKKLTAKAVLEIGLGKHSVTPSYSLAYNFNKVVSNTFGVEGKYVHDLFEYTPSLEVAFDTHTDSKATDLNLNVKPVDVTATLVKNLKLNVKDELEVKLPAFAFSELTNKFSTKLSYSYAVGKLTVSPDVSFKADYTNSTKVLALTGEGNLKLNYKPISTLDVYTLFGFSATGEVTFGGSSEFKNVNPSVKLGLSYKF